MRFKLVKIDSFEHAKKLMDNIKADHYGIDLMFKKTLNLSFLIYDCDFYIGNIVKQEALSSGIDACVSKNTVTAKIQKTDCLVFGDIKRLYLFCDKLEKQNFKNLRELGLKIKEQLDLYFGNFVWRIKDEFFDLSSKYLIMGILNITPDSFYDGGRYDTLDKALFRVDQMLNERADIIDIGAASTRPFSAQPTSEEEKSRLLPVLEIISKKFPNIIISVDTFNSSVAKEAIKYKVPIINDISGLTFNDDMVNVIKQFNCSVVIMHTKGDPKNMQQNPLYDNVILEIDSFFENALNKLSGDYDAKRIVLDPGIGFGKSLEHNIEILSSLESFKIFGRPILVGLSRKSFIGNILDKEVSDRLFGTIGANLSSFQKGARIFRVHDVMPNREALELAYRLSN